MNMLLLQGGLFSFMLGLLLSLPLAAVHYQGSTKWTKWVINPRKLKSAHLDFFMQAFAAAFVYLLEFALQSEFPIYITISIIFGTIGNPLLLLMEATPFNRSGMGTFLYILLRGTSPLALLFAWSFIAWCVLPAFMLAAFAVIILIGILLIIKYK